jgi:hypothetical protein
MPSGRPLRPGDVCNAGHHIASSTAVYTFTRAGVHPARVCLACHRESSRDWQRARRLGLTSMSEYREVLEKEARLAEAMAAWRERVRSFSALDVPHRGGEVVFLPPPSTATWRPR